MIVLFSISLEYTGSTPLELFNVLNVNATGEDDRSQSPATISFHIFGKFFLATHQHKSSARFLGQLFWECLSTISNCAAGLVSRFPSQMSSLPSLLLLQSVTSRSRDFCQFSSSLGIGIGKFSLGKKVSVSVSKNLVSEEKSRYRYRQIWSR